MVLAGEDEMRPKSSKAPCRVMLAPVHGGALTMWSLGAAPHGAQRTRVFSRPPGPHGPWLRAASVMRGFPGTSDSPCVQTKQILDACGWRPFDTVELADGGAGTQHDMLIQSLPGPFSARMQSKPAEMQ